MLGVLCARPKSWIINSLAHLHGFSVVHQSRLVHTPIQFADFNRQRHHSSVCQVVGSGGSFGGAAAIWRVIQPSGCRWSSCSDSNRYVRRLAEPRGEGSWNVAWDARPARWLHRPDSAWLLFGVCACLSPVDFWPADSDPVTVAAVETTAGGGSNGIIASNMKNGISADFEVTGVPSDGRCLFRAIAHGACLRSGEEAPDENRQTELADELRAQVADELLKRREEIEWIIEEDFEAYIKRIQQSYVWGGEPELLMASHVLRTVICVFMKDRRFGNLVNIANYGEEYQKDGVNPINVLFHGYGHYDLLATLPDRSYQRVKV